MGQIVKDKAEKARPATKAHTLYEEDLYTWVFEQVALLKAGRVAEIDVANIAEELADVGRSEESRLESALKVLLMHMLKWDQQPERRSRSWEATIREQRRRIARVLGKSPGLKARLSGILAEAYEDGRAWAAVETLLPEADFPPECPYSWDEIQTRPFEVDPAS